MKFWRLGVLRYDWEVETTRPWMRLLAPVLAPAFRRNHSEVMAAGARGLTAHLRSLLPSAYSAYLPGPAVWRLRSSRKQVLALSVDR